MWTIVWNKRRLQPSLLSEASNIPVRLLNGNNRQVRREIYIFFIAVVKFW
jgi:hypothetical protein